MTLEVIEAVASGVGIVTAFLYLIGGLIVNIHLAKYRMTEYQIVSMHYFVVGIFFLISLIGTVLMGLVAGLILFGFTLFLDTQSWRIVQSIWFWVSMSINFMLALPDRAQWVWLSKVLRFARSRANTLKVVTFIFPFVLLLRLVSASVIKSIAPTDESLIPTLFTFGIAASLYDYAWRVYGSPISHSDEQLGFGIGRGVPRMVQLSGQGQDIKPLSSIGIPLVTSELTEKIFLLAETSSHYIVTWTLDETGEVIKIRKDIVSALRHKGAVVDRKEFP